jgi:hypothetical protein
MRVVTKLLGIFALLLLPGCIEITEDIRINPDGSGSLTWATDIGAIGAAISGDNSRMDMSMLDRIREIPRQAPGILSEIKGINNPQAVYDDKKGTYSVYFEFENSRALNRAIYSLAGVKKSVGMPSLIRVSRHKVVKKDLAPYLRKALKEQKDKKHNEFVFSMIHYKSAVHLPADAKKVSNIKSRRPDSRTVVTSFSLDEMLKGGFDFGNVIRY